MPTVPRAQRRVDNQDIRTIKSSANATANQFGAPRAKLNQGYGQAVSKVGEGLLAYEKLSQDRKDKSIARDNLNKAKTEQREYMESIKDRKGSEAINTYGGSQNAFKDMKKKYFENLENDRQKEYFEASFDNMTNSNLTRALSYQENERRNFEITTLDAENVNAVQDAASMRDDQTAIDASEFTIKNNTLNKYRGMGKAAEVKANEAIHNLHASVIQAHAGDSAEKALNYTKSVWDKLDRKKRTDIKYELEQKVELETIENTAFKLSRSGLDLEGQLLEIDKIKDPKVAREVRDRVVSSNKINEQVKVLRKKKVYEAEVDKIFQNPHIYASPKDVPLDTLDGKDQKDLWKLQKSLQEDELGIGAKTDFVLYAKLFQMSYTDRKAFKNTNLVELKPKLAKAEFKELLKLQRGDEEKAFKLATPYAVMNARIKGFDEFDPKQGEESNVRKGRLITELSNHMRSLPEKDRTEESANAFLNNALSPVETDTAWFDGYRDRQLYNFEVNYLGEDEQKMAFPAEVPDELRAYGKALKYDPEFKVSPEAESLGGVFYVQGRDVIRVYNLNGTEIKRYRNTGKR